MVTCLKEWGIHLGAAYDLAWLIDDHVAQAAEELNSFC